MVKTWHSVSLKKTSPRTFPEPAADPVANPVDPPAADPVAEPMGEPAADPVAQPTAEPMMDRVAELMAEALAERKRVAEPKGAAEPLAEPKPPPDPLAELLADPAFAMRVGAEAPQKPVRLAVCPHCRTVSERGPGESDGDEPVKLVTCWWCSKQVPEGELMLARAPESKPAWLDEPESDRKLVGGYGMLILLLLGCAYVASQLWFESRTRAPSATGVVSSPTPERSSAPAADGTALTPSPDLVLAPPAAGPAAPAALPAAPGAREAIQSPAPAPAPRPATRARAPAPTPLPAPADTACTPGAAALGLCGPNPTNRRP